MEFELQNFFISDFHNFSHRWGTGVLQPIISNSISHICLGLVIGGSIFLLELSMRWFFAFFCLIVMKDFAFDLRYSDYQTIVFFDAFWDLACYAFGVCAVWTAIMFKPQHRHKS